MDNVIKYFESINSAFRNAKILGITGFALGAVVAVCGLYYGYSAQRRADDRVYLVSQEGIAFSADNASGLDLNRIEVEDHVIRFHQYMFNLAPSTEAIESSLDAAMELADRSAYKYRMECEEIGFYSSLVSGDISQSISISDIKTDMTVQPYQVQVTGSILQLRPSTISKFSFVSTCTVVKTQRSRSNPHGMRIENFHVANNDLIEKRKRN